MIPLQGGYRTFKIKTIKGIISVIKVNAQIENSMFCTFVHRRPGERFAATPAGMRPPALTRDVMNVASAGSNALLHSSHKSDSIG